MMMMKNKKSIFNNVSSNIVRVAFTVLSILIRVIIINTLKIISKINDDYKQYRRASACDNNIMKCDEFKLYWLIDITN
jgi:hypothetical protein